MSKFWEGALGIQCLFFLSEGTEDNPRYFQVPLWNKTKEDFTMKNLVKEWLKATLNLVSYPFRLAGYWIVYAIGYLEASWEAYQDEKNIDYTYEKFGETYEL